MEVDTPENLLAQLSEFVAQTMGWDFPPSRHADLRRGIAAAAKDLGFDSAADCAQKCLSGALSKQQLDRVASHLTIGETYFFRESKAFEILASEILPRLIHSRRAGNRELRIWSAGCCTGEEPYSIAILLQQVLVDWQSWKITLLATDINPQFLGRAEAGIFGQWSFRCAPAWLKERYFRSAAERRFEILPEIRRMVRFEQLNLAAESYGSILDEFGPMDIIFCRNVLMYFRPPQAAKVIDKLYGAQTDGGWLIVSASELSGESFVPYFAAHVRGCTVYQKDSHRPSKIGPEPVAPSATAFSLFPSPGTPGEGQCEGSGSGAILSRPSPSQAEPARRLPECREMGKTSAHPEEIPPPVLLETGETVVEEPSPAMSALGVEARSLADQGNLVGALGCCDRWIAADKLNPASHYLRSVVLQEQGAILEAMQSLRRALYLDPDHVLAHFALGNIARGRKEMRESRRHLANALRLLKKYPPQTVLPESEGVTAGLLAEMIGSLSGEEVAA